MSQEERAVIFGRDADAYERHRPDFPREAIEHLMGLVEVRTALEIGAGTGKATESVARDGIELTCLEPASAMASVLRGRDLPHVEVIESTFEEWEGPAGGFDLIFAAQAWHWVDQDRGYDLAKDLLRPGGALAVMWNLSLVRYEPFEHIYRRLAPELLEEQDQRIARRDNPPWIHDLAVNGFHDVQRFVHRWDRELSGADVRGLYSSYSDHLLLAETVREPLLDEVEAEVAAHGGSLVVPYSTEVFSGKTR